MATVLGGPAFIQGAAPKPIKPPKTPSSLATTVPLDNTVSAAAANGGYGGIVAAFPASVQQTSVAPSVAPTTPDPNAVGAAAGITTPTDWNAELANDPALAAQAQAVSAGSVTNAANLHAQRAQLLAQFGYIPANLSGQLQGDVNSDIDATTRGLASASTAGGVSTYAQLQKAYKDAQASSYASLAARGLVHSGAAGQHANENLLAYDQAYEQSTQKLMGDLQSYYQTYLQQQAAGQTTLADATNQALQRIIARIQANQYAQAQAATAASQSAQTAELLRRLAEAANGSGAPGNIIDPNPPYNPPSDRSDTMGENIGGVPVEQAQQIAQNYGLSTDTYSAPQPLPAPNYTSPPITPSQVQRFRQLVR